VGITAGSREVPGRNAFDRRHTYCIIIIIIITPVRVTSSRSMKRNKLEDMTSGTRGTKSVDRYMEHRISRNSGIHT